MPPPVHEVLHTRTVGCQRFARIRGAPLQVAESQRRQADAEAALVAAKAQHDADAAAHATAQQSGLSSEVTALRSALTEARERAAQREDALQATIADLSGRVRPAPCAWTDTLELASPCA